MLIFILLYFLLAIVQQIRYYLLEWKVRMILSVNSGPCSIVCGNVFVIHNHWNRVVPFRCQTTSWFSIIVQRNNNLFPTVAFVLDRKAVYKSSLHFS